MIRSLWQLYTKIYGEEKKKMIVAIIAVLIGLLLIGAGGYYFIKEKSDKESRKIYMITMLIGVIIVIGALA